MVEPNPIESAGYPNDSDYNENEFDSCKNHVFAWLTIKGTDEFAVKKITSDIGMKMVDNRREKLSTI